MQPDSFKDHFSGHAAAYADARPRYPVELFQWLATLTAQHALAWDCGTGNGQAALGLAEHFKKVIATDPSKEQIANAFPHAHVEYRVAAAASPGLDHHSVDLVTVAQALHWFDLPKFYAQLKRVLKSDGAIAAWCYGLCSITPDIDAVLRDFYNSTVGPYWPPERRLIDDAYRTLEFPFREITPPAFSMRHQWDLAQFLAYLDTWSAVQRYIQENGRNPVGKLGDTLRRVWGAPDSQRTVSWPLHIRAGRIKA
ncbi:MAG TPA: class I SAM-dependent methyltransferase [Gammaproteobacteria bacterium]|nr:class I SAM-dependent methyltransferase [Gammaproteobacteria bacterium]